MELKWQRLIEPYAKNVNSFLEMFNSKKRMEEEKEKHLNGLITKNKHSSIVVDEGAVEIEKKNNKVYLNGTNTLAGSVVNMHDTFLNLLKMKMRKTIFVLMGGLARRRLFPILYP